MRLAVVMLLSAGLAAECLASDVVSVQPPRGAFKMRKELQGKHPRLYFSMKDIPEIRRQGLGPRKWFADRVKANFKNRAYGKDVKPNMPAWERYLYGFWALVGADFLYVVEGDPMYADTGKRWVKYWLGVDDWSFGSKDGHDDLIPMDILSGVAITYDVLYQQFSEDERMAIRERLFKEIKFIHQRFFVGQYWTHDFQNNHMHNRICGLANAAFAIYGDDPKMDVQEYADLAAASILNVAKWLPEDGSQHEGPGYWSYGHHWVVRIIHLYEHVTGEDLVSKNPHFTDSHYFRLYMSAPGWENTFGIGDSGSGPPDNLTAVCRSIAEAKDPHGQAWLQEMMKTNEGAFYQHPAWGLLWYDASVAPKPVDELPLWRFWPDLEMFSIRSSWRPDATAFVFKCGPVGGHRMQKLRNGAYVNVAHDHPDQNHFLLFAHGRFLAEDDGYPKQKKLTRSHNTIVIDGKGQPREGTGWQQPFPYEQTGFMQDLFLSHSTAYAAGDASPLYDNAERFIRHVAFVNGGYVIVVDDVVGAGGGEHEFDWRLHKKGDWKKQGEGRFSAAEGDVSLDIRFLHPPGNAMQAAFLPAELTAPPCLSVKQRARAANFVAVLVPQKDGAADPFSELLKGANCIAVRFKSPQYEDFFAVAQRPGSMSFGDAKALGSAALLRVEGARDKEVVSALLVRGGSLSFDGDAVLSSSKPANLSRRVDGREIVVEAEAPYESLRRAKGIELRESKSVRADVKIGALKPRKTYSVTVNGERAGSERSDGGGVIKITLDLKERCVVRIR